MTLPLVAFNSSTGSDVNRSGYAASAAVGGTGAATVSGTAVVTVLADNPDLSAVAAGDLMWVDSSSGRQFSIIVSDDNGVGVKTVTCADNFANTEGSRNWGIGGKRATLNNANSRKLFTADWKAGWIVETEDDQTITTSAIALFTAGDVVSGYITIRGKSGAVRTITTTFNGAIFSNSGTAWFRFQNLKLTCSAATKTSSIGISTTGATRVQIVDCILGDATNTLNVGINNNGVASLYLYNVEIVATLSHCINNTAGGSALELVGCWLHGAAGSGKGINYTGTAGILIVKDSVISGNASDGILFALAATNTYLEVARCVIHGNGGDGIDLATALSAAAGAKIYSNNITGQTGGYGINAAAGADALKLLIDYNNFGTGGLVNSSGSMNNLTAGAHDLAVDPGYVNAAGNNFAAGTAIKAKGYPDAAINLGDNASATLDFIDIGIQRQESGTAVAGGAYYGG